MKFNFFVLLFLVATTCGQPELLGHLNDYENCLVVPESSDNVVVFWTIESGTTLHMAMSSKNYGGYMAVGWNKDGLPYMLPADAVIANVVAGVGNVTDSDLDGYSSCISNSGVCSDTVKGYTNDILSGDFVGNQTTGVATMTFSRLLNTGDSSDFVITNTDVNTIYALGRNYNLIQHRANNVPFTINYFTQRTTCPTAVTGTPCSGHGNCTKGCCVCDVNYSGSDCSIQDSTPTPTPTSSLTSEIVPSDYPFNQKLDDKLTIYWRITDDKELIEIALDCDCSGWVGFGPSKSGRMVDSDVVVAYFDNGNLVINDHYITGQSGSCPGVCVDTNNRIGGEDNILDYNGNNNNNKLQVKYIRKLKTGDTNGDIDIVEGEMNAIWGFHPDSLYPAQHQSQTKSNIKINFFSGKASETVDLKLVHGILMFLAWSVFVPITSFLARYLKKFKWWFNVHRYVNTVMMAVVIASFGIAIAVTSSGEHFNKPHSIIGLIVFIIAIAQPILGVVADKMFDPERKSVPAFPDKTHWVLGWGGLTLGLINVLLGLILYGEKGLVIGYGVYFAVVGAFLLFWAVYKQIVGIEGGH